MRCRVASAIAYAIVSLMSQSIQVTALTADPKLCGKACRQTYRTLRFSDTPEGAFFAVQECTSLLYQTSLHICWDIHCTKDVWLSESRKLNETCQEINGSRLPPHSIIDDLTDLGKSQIARFNATIPGRSSPFDVPMLPTEAYHDLWMRTLDAHDYVWWYHHYYGWAMGIFWAGVVAVGITTRMAMQSSFGHGTSNAWLKRNVLVPATFGRRCVQDFGGWGTLPPRLQTLTIALFLLINIACSLHGYRVFEGYGYYPLVWMQLLRHVSDRTGIISFANFPLIWLFGMRNNLVIWLTGWDLKTFYNFHRWVGRIAAVQAVIHSIGYTVLIVERGGWIYFWRICHMTYWWMGELATISMCLLVCLSIFWLRRQQYEFFLIAHIVLSVLLLLTMLGHVSIFRGDYDPLVWVPALIWLLDRILRGVRIIAFSQRIWNLKAFVTYNKDAHMIRMTIPLSSTLSNIPPGTFYYVMILNKWNFWESHPFTVASVSGRRQYTNRSSTETSPLLQQISHTYEHIATISEEKEREVTFVIRPYDSFTLRLKKRAEAAYPKPATLPVAVEGPYGKSLPLESFDKVLFLVGGSGIAVPLSYLGRLTKFSSQTRSITIHWAVRQIALALDILNHELSQKLHDRRVKIVIYLTGLDDTKAHDEAVFRLVELRSKRMNVEEVVNEACETENESSIAVVTSGPGRMADESRSAVAARTVRSLPHIEYFEESFQW